MPFKTAKEAEDAFLGAIRTALGCIVKDAVVVFGGSKYGAGLYKTFSFAKGEPVKLRGQYKIWLKIGHRYSVVEHQKADWLPKTYSYEYAFFVDDIDSAGELIAFQWHPRGSSRVRWGHLHLKQAANVGCHLLKKAHIPTNRIAVEDLVQLAISEFGVKARVPDWRKVLRATKNEFEKKLHWLVQHGGL